MIHVEVCADSGLLPARSSASGARQSVLASPSPASTTARRSARCPHTLTELFIEGTEPTRTDDWHWVYSLDVRNGLLAGPGCAPEFTLQKRYTVYPAEAQDWIRWQHIPQPPDAYSPLCPSQALAQAAQPGAPATESGQASSPSRSAPLLLTSPDEGSHYRLSPEIPRSAQQINVAARAADGVSLQQVTLLVDGHPIATLSSPPYQALWEMTAGMHVFSAVGMGAGGEEWMSHRVTVEVTEEK